MRYKTVIEGDGCNGLIKIIDTGLDIIQQKRQIATCGALNPLNPATSTIER